MIIKLICPVLFTDLKAAPVSCSAGTHMLLMMMMIVNLQVGIFKASELGEQHCF